MQGVAVDRRVQALSGLFLASGAAGLMYQVSWQRLLFAAFGSDLLSVTIIVSAFMAGLGLGAMAGGAAADRWPTRALALFCACEAAIGAFGLVSHWLLPAAGDAFVTADTFTVAVVNFLLVLAPALLMGATLPILVTHLARLWRHVGEATGTLYAVNTVGAAAGALLPTFWLLHHMGLADVIRLAAATNLVVAAVAGLWLGAWSVPAEPLAQAARRDGEGQ
ncbi:MAG: fused MFS/spermidine synthase [Burkholderiales bacterium]|nr:fused MFS/spermidine synthase [Burkholderiales bacterium]